MEIEEKITFEKLDDGTCVITVSGKNHLGQSFIQQDIVRVSIFNALNSKLQEAEKRVDELLKSHSDWMTIAIDRKKRIEELEEGLVSIYNGIMEDINWTETSPIGIINKLLNP